MSDPTRPGVDELYETAVNAKDLTVTSRVRGAADILIAVGGSPTRLGTAMLRLHSEWEAAAKPIKPSEVDVKRLALTMPDKKGRPDVVGARRLAGEWYVDQLAALVGRLKALPMVRAELMQQAQRWGMQDAEDKSCHVIRYWLDQTCHACHGLARQRMVGAPVLSPRLCPVCHGSGVNHPPCGSDGRRLANFMDRCVEDARGLIKNRLHSLKG